MDHNLTMSAKHLSSGWSLIEAMVAMAIFALVAVSLVSLSAGSLNPWLGRGATNQAEALAQEGLETVRTIKDRAWNELVFAKSGLSWSGSVWSLTGENTEETVGIYTRYLEFFEVCRNDQNQIAVCPATRIDPHLKQVKATVKWGTTPSAKQVVKILYLANWNSRFWQQDNWIGGAGQTIWLDGTKFDSSENINASTTNAISLELNKTSGWLMSSAFKANTVSKIQVIEWEGATPLTTKIQFQIRVAPDANGVPGVWSAWYGAEGAGTYFINKQGSLISKLLNDNKWIQYRVELIADGVVTPTLYGVKINYK